MGIIILEELITLAGNYQLIIFISTSVPIIYPKWWAGYGGYPSDGLSPPPKRVIDIPIRSDYYLYNGTLAVGAMYLDRKYEQSCKEGYLSISLRIVRR